MKPIYIAWKSQHNSSWSLVSANYTNQTKQGSIDSYSTRHFNKQNGQPRSQINSQQDNRWASNGSGWSNRFNCPYQPRCQICNQLGHITKTFSQFYSNTTINAIEKPWLLDSIASYNITIDLANLSTHSRYDA